MSENDNYVDPKNSMITFLDREKLPKESGRWIARVHDIR